MSDPQPFQSQIDEIKEAAVSIEAKEKRIAHKIAVNQYIIGLGTLAAMIATYLIGVGAKQANAANDVENLKDDLSNYQIQTNKLIQDVTSLVRGHSEEIRKNGERVAQFQEQLRAVDKKLDASNVSQDKKLDIVIGLMKGQK